VSSGSCQGFGGALFLVVEHAAVDNVGEVAFEDAHGFGFGVPAAAGVLDDVAGLRVAAELGNGHAVEHGVDSAVAAPIETMPHGFAVAFCG
jgi:hypothetical protein